jgi:two-component system, OmpR family, response regulator
MTEKLDHVLIVDDDRGIQELVGSYLEKYGMRVSLAGNGNEMRNVLESGVPDLIVLDLVLPGEDGLVLCRELRTGKFRTVPVVMLSARSDEMDRIVGLEMGADDYLPKPFAMRELFARIRSVLRRTRMLPPGMRMKEMAQLLAFGDWRLDTSARHLLDAEGTMVALSGAEYRLLRVFLDHPQRLLTRDQLLDLTQSRQADQFDRSIDQQVSRLRQRLHIEASERRYIKTLRSEGYVFSAAVTVVEAHE